MPFCLISEIIHPRFNIILPRVNNFDIKQKKHGIFVLLYGTNTKQHLGRYSKCRSKHKFFLVKTEQRKL